MGFGYRIFDWTCRGSTGNSARSCAFGGAELDDIVVVVVVVSECHGSCRLTGDVRLKGRPSIRDRGRGRWSLGWRDEGAGGSGSEV